VAHLRRGGSGGRRDRGVYRGPQHRARARDQSLRETGQALAEEQAGITPHPASGLSPTAYDLLHIGAWALVIFGALLIIVGLIGYWAVANA
jgi:hypothetical protein